MIFDDYFLPSKDELNAMYTELYLYGFGGFGDITYWSSSETNSIDACSQSFNPPSQFSNVGKDSGDNTRACRAFTSLTNYNLRDVGQAGGYIFWKSGNDYLEAAQSDIGIYTQIWSNIDSVEIGATAQGTAIGTGQANTTAIINQAGHTDSAAKLCDDLIINTGITTRGITISHKLSTRITSINLVPSVVFAINPGLGGCYEFLDMFISSSYKPSSILLAVDKDFTDIAVVSGSKIRTYDDGWFYVQRFPKTAAGKVLVGNILFVKIFFNAQDLFYDLKITKTGYKEIVGG